MFCYSVHSVVRQGVLSSQQTNIRPRWFGGCIVQSLQSVQVGRFYIGFRGCTGRLRCLKTKVRSFQVIRVDIV